MNYATQSSAIVAAMIGTGLIFDLLRDAALSSRDDLDALTEETRVKLCDTFGLTKNTSCSSLQSAKVPKGGTFYTYVLGLRAFFNKSGEPVTREFLVKIKGSITRETFDVSTIKAGVMTAQSKLAKELAESKVDTGAPSDTVSDTVSGAPSGTDTGADPFNPAPIGPVLTLPTILAALESMHSAGMLQAADYARLAGIRPVVKLAPMADVVGLRIAA